MPASLCLHSSAGPVHEMTGVEKAEEKVEKKIEEKEGEGKTYNTAIDLDTYEAREAKQALDAFLDNHDKISFQKRRR
jgi:hypothetical protein